MISQLEIENFRSIISDKITLEPITVLIGANGSGKSNLVKALEFLSDIPKTGIHHAVSRQGGRGAIAPKAIPLREISKFNTRFKYTTSLLPPNAKEIYAPNSIDVVHEFELSFSSRQRLKILREKLVFNKVLFVGEVLSHEKRAPNIPKDSPSHPDSDSTFTINHEGGSQRFEVDPPISEQTIENYLHWLGLASLQKKIATSGELEKFLKSFRVGRSRRLTGKGGVFLRSPRGLFLDPDTPTFVDYSPNFQILLATIESIKRYDLLLNELRREQSPSDSPKLTKVGANMPAALRRLASDKAAYKRLKTSFEAIAPHIINMKSSPLRTGKEFVEFIETNEGRGIESWESSDGSLRALAILVALETTDDGQTVIIEEPEQNLHPWAVRTLIDHMREVVKERSIQLILTTHSEHVLERVEANEVRVVTRTTDKGTKFMRIDQIISKGKIHMGEIGRLWVKGLLGGVPTVI